MPLDCSRGVVTREDCRGQNGYLCVHPFDIPAAIRVPMAHDGCPLQTFQISLKPRVTNRSCICWHFRELTSYTSSLVRHTWLLNCAQINIILTEHYVYIAP